MVSEVGCGKKGTGTCQKVPVRPQPYTASQKRNQLRPSKKRNARGRYYRRALGKQEEEGSQPEIAIEEPPGKRARIRKPEAESRRLDDREDQGPEMDGKGQRPKRPGAGQNDLGDRGNVGAREGGIRSVEETKDRRTKIGIYSWKNYPLVEGKSHVKK
jgi:hypothetical protein